MFPLSIMRWIEIAIVAGVLMFVGFLWFSRANALSDLDKANKANVEATLKLAQITSDIQDVRIKQEVAVIERDRIEKVSNILLNTIRKQKAPKDCKALVKFSVDNKKDLEW